MQRFPCELSDSFAKIVEKYRTAKGFSRSALAAQAGLHQTYIGLLERGSRSPNLDTAQAIAKSLGCRLSQMIAEAEELDEEKVKKAPRKSRQHSKMRAS
jgi:transcriptional regulator with XRE-family HTH domain